ncbi:MAG: hypothetical protein PHU71_04300 [Candidatus Gracilibacteria bacterium]|nr:hypothetical protein [Candidatus Gracilibacteria bacterium]
MNTPKMVLVFMVGGSTQFSQNFVCYVLAHISVIDVMALNNYLLPGTSP